MLTHTSMSLTEVANNISILAYWAIQLAWTAKLFTLGANHRNVYIWNLRSVSLLLNCIWWFSYYPAWSEGGGRVMIECYQPIRGRFDRGSYKVLVRMGAPLYSTNFWCQASNKTIYYIGYIYTMLLLQFDFGTMCQVLFPWLLPLLSRTGLM